MENKRNVVLYIAMSLDGYIADNEDNIEFLNVVEQDGEDYGYADFLNSVDTILIGRKTYDKVKSMGFNYPPDGKKAFVISRKPGTPDENTRFYSGDLNDLVQNLKSESGKNIYCDGGAEIVNLLIDKNLIDELIISIIPVLLGNGKRLFSDNQQFKNLKLVNCKHFPKGLVQLHYERVNSYG